ncbi:MAG: radical SAM protein, partial [Deltaproteobacteria bacterium]|nr:radical SAM protein [Deltaproteobacteria bacterium]
IIPFTRGPSRSRPLSDIVEQVHRFVANGYAEVVLTGIHLGAWGEDLEGEGDLLTLLKAIVRETDLPRLRISSIEPMQLNDHLLDFWLSQERISPFLHLSIQSGDDEILRRMRRRYTAGHCRQIVERFVQRKPESYVGFDLIVGFPGETEAHFGRTLHFLENTPWAKLHAFPFSPRPLTAAARYPDQVSSAIVKQRMDTLLAMSEERYCAFQSRHVGVTLPAIPIGNGESSIQRAVTDNYLTVYFREKESSCTPPIRLNIEEFRDGKLFGKIVAAGK